MTKNPKITRLSDEITPFLRGFGQIIFQANALSGLIFMLAIGLNSGAMLIGSVIGVWCSTQSAKWFGGDPEVIHQGLYGYNGALIGLSVMLFYRLDLTSLGLIALAAMLSSLLLQQLQQQLLQRFHWLSPLTAPFLIMVWLVFAAADLFTLVPVVAQPLMIETNPVMVFFRGYGQMLFQANALSGLLILIGVAISSKTDAVWAMCGVVLAMVVVSVWGQVLATPVGFSAESAAQGFYSFSAALIAVALANQTTPGNKLAQLMIVTAGVILAVLLTLLGQLADLTALTAPFVLSMWLILTLVWAWRQWWRA